MTTQAEDRALACIKDSPFDYTSAETVHMMDACIRFARGELLLELVALRDMDMGSASDRIISRVDELRDMDES